MVRRAFHVALFLCLPSALIAQQTPSAPTPSTPAAPAAAESTPPVPPTPHTLMDGTPIKLRLTQTISSADAKVDQEIPFEVVEDVKVDDVVVLPKGSTAIGTVTEAN